MGRVPEIHQKRPLTTAGCRDYQPEFLGVLIQGVSKVFGRQFGYHGGISTDFGVRGASDLFVALDCT